MIEMDFTRFYECFDFDATVSLTANIRYVLQSFLSYSTLSSYKCCE